MLLLSGGWVWEIWFFDNVMKGVGMLFLREMDGEGLFIGGRVRHHGATLDMDLFGRWVAGGWMICLENLRFPGKRV